MAAIVAGDILWKRSVSAAAGNTTAQADPNASLGDQISTTAWAGGTLNDLFDDVSAAENTASEAEYRCIFIHNNNGANTYENVVIWISAETALGASIALAADSTAASAVGSGSAQALSVADENTAPAGPLTFTSPTTQGAGVSLGNIPAGSVKAFWIRRTAANNAALSADGMTLSIFGETGSL
jgi:hypothetical protein